ncbi:uncharacterized protein LOC110025445 [Phalaenopsis equestris]|uniref:uncharacterized protein LOC110025445 n=1 Tax=Phalaenopsis equestris TaxID=78828 RepID=UPI0009E1DFE6|nr:uncharacterized protein LOC110025445 [Phalaenopsis equestris]
MSGAPDASRFEVVIILYIPFPRIPLSQQASNSLSQQFSKSKTVVFLQPTTFSLRTPPLPLHSRSASVYFWHPKPRATNYSYLPELLVIYSLSPSSLLLLPPTPHTLLLQPPTFHPVISLLQPHILSSSQPQVP